MISIKNLTKVYGKETIFEKISIDFRESTIYGLVGANGCGKTTFMRCICGFAQPTNGTIIVNNILVGKDVDFAPDTGMILETPGFLPYYTGLRNLEILARVSGKATQQRAKDVMTLVGLDPDDKKGVGKYSLGMNQRLGIAQAIMEDPSILILDEPFNGLDRQGVLEIHELLQQQKRQEKIIILASHSATDIEQACDIVYEFDKKGRLVEMG